MLYKKEDIPKGLEGKGTFEWYGSEYLFSPFGGNSIAINTDWTCKNCGKEWYYNDIIKHYDSHCPMCGRWIGLNGLKFKQKQNSLF